MQDYEKLGVFYLGKKFDPKKHQVTDELLLYDSKNFTTHAVCVGMTGSGKTGLGISVIEEAALDGIPAIIVDPKGDLANLKLTFPDLSTEEFLPWVDPAEVQRKGFTTEDYAEAVAKQWKEGLASSGEEPERIKRLREKVDIVIYTPASQAGVSISILSSFAAPSKELLLDSGVLRDRILSLTSSVLGLLGINADPIKSREHILISTIIDRAWREGKDLDIGSLIQQVQKPPFSKIGVLDINTFYPEKDRLALSVSLNNLLASPGFHAWMEGEPLDIQQMLYTKSGKPKLSVVSIAHLGDSERMFFVTLLLNEVLTWMRRQPGTTSLRALLYMDEIFGYFPPTAMPPSKLPMLTLLKQARAFGLGVMLCTQNPVDLDYKGLSNCGTWFIGKLQTERDKARVLEGLQIASNGEVDAKSLDKMMSAVGSRIFIMRSIYEKDPILFHTRWTMSYLRGPLTLTQIASLKEKPSEIADNKPQKLSGEALNKSQTSDVVAYTSSKPVVLPGIAEYYEHSTSFREGVRYEPFVVGFAKLHFVDPKLQVDVWKEMCVFAAVNREGTKVNWESGRNLPLLKNQLDHVPLPDSIFAELPTGLMQPKNYVSFGKDFSSYLYQTQELRIYKSKLLEIVSKEGETESEFKARIALQLREKRDEMVSKIRSKYVAKIATLTDKVKRAEEKLELQKNQASSQKTDTWISVITTFIGMLFGRGITKGTINQAGTSLKRAGKIGKESQEVVNAEENYNAVSKQLADLQAEMQRETIGVIGADSRGFIDGYDLEEIIVKPRKSDITVNETALAWCFA